MQKCIILDNNREKLEFTFTDNSKIMVSTKLNMNIFMAQL